MDAAEREGRYAYECGERKGVGDQMAKICKAVSELETLNEADRNRARSLAKAWGEIERAMIDEKT